MDREEKFLRISVASPDEIRSRSSGEVKSALTLNPRSGKPEEGGLFCERIFGPLQDWRCRCGSYRCRPRKKKNVVCEHCGVDVTLSRVRRHRIGHIELAVPVVHPWFLHRKPIIPDLLGVNRESLEKVVYYDAYLVTAVDNLSDCEYSVGTILSPEEYLDGRRQYRNLFQAGMGGKAIRTVLKELDLSGERRCLENIEEKISSGKISLGSTATTRILARIRRKLDAVRHCLEHGINPANLVLTVLPVLPPDLRPILPNEAGGFSTHDLNILYKEVLSRNNMLRSGAAASSPKYLREVGRRLQADVDALFDNGLHGIPKTGYGCRVLNSLTHCLQTGFDLQKSGSFAQAHYGKTVDYSAATVAVTDPALADETVLIPREIARKLLESRIVCELKKRGMAFFCRSAVRMIARKEPTVEAIMEEQLKKMAVLVTHPPVIRPCRARFFKAELSDDNALHLSPRSFRDMEFDMPSSLARIYMPLSAKAQNEAKYLTDHPLKQKEMHQEAGLILQMLRFDLEEKPLLCSSCEYAARVYREKRLPINAHVQLPEQIHTSIGGALLALEIPGILSPEQYPESVPQAERLLEKVRFSAGLRELMFHCRHQLSPVDEERVPEDFPGLYEQLQRRFREGKTSMPRFRFSFDQEAACLNFFADFAAGTYCRNRLHETCSVAECPAHGLSGTCGCLFAKESGLLPDYGSAIGLKAVYRLLSFLEHPGGELLIQRLYRHLNLKDAAVVHSMKKAAEMFSFPCDFPEAEVELLLTIQKQRISGLLKNDDFFRDGKRNAPETILDAVWNGRKINLRSPEAIFFSGKFPPTCAAETAIRRSSRTTHFPHGD